jgi:hypothetical protein
MRWLLDDQYSRRRPLSNYQLQRRRSDRFSSSFIPSLNLFQPPNILCLPAFPLKPLSKPKRTVWPPFRANCSGFARPGDEGTPRNASSCPIPLVCVRRRPTSTAFAVLQGSRARFPSIDAVLLVKSEKGERKGRNRLVCIATTIKTVRCSASRPPLRPSTDSDSTYRSKCCC